MPQITVFIVQAVLNQWGSFNPLNISIQKSKPDVGVEEKDPAQHHSIATKSQNHGCTNSYYLKAMEILAQKFQVLFQEEDARKWKERNVFSTC